MFAWLFLTCAVMAFFAELAGITATGISTSISFLCVAVAEQGVTEAWHGLSDAIGYYQAADLARHGLSGMVFLASAKSAICRSEVGGMEAIIGTVGAVFFAVAALRNARPVRLEALARQEGRDMRDLAKDILSSGVGNQLLSDEREKTASSRKQPDQTKFYGYIVRKDNLTYR